MPQAHLDGKGLLGPGWSPGRVRLCWEAGQAAKRRVLAGQMRFTDDEIDAVAQVLQSDPDIRFAPMAVKVRELTAPIHTNTPTHTPKRGRREMVRCACLVHRPPHWICCGSGFAPWVICIMPGSRRCASW